MEFCADVLPTGSKEHLSLQINNQHRNARDLKPAIPILGIKKRTPGTAILAISGTEMLKIDGLS